MYLLYLTSEFAYSFRQDFFTILHDTLAGMEEVTELQPVPDAHVPVMKLKFNGISLDLLYASISLLVVPEVSWLLEMFTLILFWHLSPIHLGFTIRSFL